MRALARHCAKRQAARSAAPPRSGGWVEIPQCTAGGWRSAWARGITREGYPKRFGRAERKAANNFLRKVLKTVPVTFPSVQTVVGTTWGVHEFGEALKKGAKAKGREGHGLGPRRSTEAGQRQAGRSVRPEEQRSSRVTRSLRDLRSLRKERLRSYRNRTDRPA